MANLTPDGQPIVDDASRRYSIGTDAVRLLLEALVSSGGGMAQFNHPDLGGMGQWSSGGMIMIGDMFNNDLKSRIGALCAELSDVIRHTDIVANRSRSSQWQSQGTEGSTPLPQSKFFRERQRSFWRWWRLVAVRPWHAGLDRGAKQPAQCLLSGSSMSGARREWTGFRPWHRRTSDHRLRTAAKRGSIAHLYQPIWCGPAGQPASDFWLRFGFWLPAECVGARARRGAEIDEAARR